MLELSSCQIHKSYTDGILLVLLLLLVSFHLCLFLVLRPNVQPHVGLVLGCQLEGPLPSPQRCQRPYLGEGILIEHVRFEVLVLQVEDAVRDGLLVCPPRRDGPRDRPAGAA